MAAHHFAQLLDDLKGVAQEVALHGRKLARLDEAGRRGFRDLCVKSKRQEVVERLSKLAGELRLEEAELGEPLDTGGRARLVQAFFQRKRPHSMDDREDAALLEVKRIALGLGGDKVVEEADRGGERVDRAGEARQTQALSLHEADEV